MKKVIAVVLMLMAAGTTLAADGYTKNVAIVIYNGVEVLDFTGPAEVFAAASPIAASGGQNAFNVYTVAKTKAPIVSQGFLDVTPDYSIADSPSPASSVPPGADA